MEKRRLKEMKKMNLGSFKMVLSCVLLFAFLLHQPIYGQAQKLVSGTVQTEKGMPLPGVTVSIKNSDTGTVTNFDGEFEIPISKKDEVLVFRYLGFVTKEVKIDNQSSINVVLKQDAAQLDKVVVVGYGTQKKVNLTGAVSTISSEDIQNRPVTSLGAALQGTVPGLSISRSSGQPGSEGMDIQIRGATSASGAVDPLVIIDQITMTLSDLNNLNPNDVASISVLKDAAAAAIYGARAAGGVILVTTKRGSEGPATFKFSSQYTLQWPLNIPERPSLLEEALYVNLAGKNAGIGQDYTAQDLEYIRNGIEFVEDPNNPSAWMTYNQQDVVDKVVRDYYPMKDYNLSVSGGSENIRYYLSGGFLDQKGIFKVGPDANERYNGRLNLGIDLTKHLTLDTRLAYTKQKVESAATTISGYGLFKGLYQTRQRFPIFTPDGRLFGGGGSSGFNAYAYLTEGGYTHNETGDLNGNFTLTAKDFVEGLKFTAIYGLQETHNNYERFNRTVELWDKGGMTPAYYLNNPNSYNVRRGKENRENFQFLIDYEIEFEEHQIHLLGGYQWEDYRRHIVSAGASSLVSNDLPSLNFGSTNSKTNSESIITYANQSYFGRFNYNFSNKYLFEFTIRGDATSRLAPRSRLSWFPSASVGWNMHKEDWFEEALPFLSIFKPRVSWGQLGNSNSDIIGYYDYIPGLNYGNGLVMGAAQNRTTYFYQNGLPSPNLAWEIIETFNYGIDIALFENKLRGSFDYYTKENQNMLIPTVLPGTIGINTPRVNEGLLKSWGWEASLSYRDRIGDDFSYTVGVNLSDNQNELVNYGGNSSSISARRNRLIEGFPLNTIWGYETVPGYIQSEEQLENTAFYSNKTGVGDIAYVDQNGDGLIDVGRGTVEDHGDLVRLGADHSRYIFGINASAKYKNIDFSIFLQGVGKRSFLVDNRGLIPLGRTWFQPMAYHMDFWTPDNRDAAFPRPYTNGHQSFATSDRWLMDGSYLRVKNIQVGYSLPSSVLETLQIKSLRVYVSAKDILTFSNLGVFEGIYDPEQDYNALASYPFSAAMAVGVNLSF